MSGTNAITYLLTESISDTLKNRFRVIGDFCGRSINCLQNLPQRMNDTPNMPIAIIVTTNIVFFTAINAIANVLNTQIEKCLKQPSFTNKIIKNILLDGVVVGGSALAFNYFLSKATNYPLSKLTLTFITVAVIAVRVFVCHYYTAKDKNAQEVKQREVEEIKQPEAELVKNQQEPEEVKKQLEEEVNLKLEPDQAQEIQEAKKQLEAEAKIMLEPEQVQQEVQEAKKQLQVNAKIEQEAEQVKKPQEDEAIKQLEPEPKMQPIAEQAKKQQEDEVKKQEKIKEAAKIELQKNLTDGLKLLRNLENQKEKLRRLPKPHSKAKKMIDLMIAAYPNNEAFKRGPAHQRVQAMYEQLQVLALPINNAK